MRPPVRALLCGASLASWPSTTEAAPTGREDAQTDAAPADETQARAASDMAAPSPPRIDGPYLGLGLLSGVGLARVNEFDTDAPYAAFGGSIRFGQMVLPWLGLGLRLVGLGGVSAQDGARQTLGGGALLVDFDFVPVPKRLPLTLLASFGFGGGAVVEEGRAGRGGFGGAAFGLGARYEFFPGVMRYRPTTGGGFGLGPEVGWFGSTPAAAGRPMAHAFYLGLSMTFYFGD